MATPVYETAIIKKWSEVRPHENAESVVSKLMEDAGMRLMMQLSFETGRDWQHNHPNAQLGFSDHDVAA